MRFPGQLNMSSRKLATNLIPFSRYSFLLNQIYPMSGIHSQQKMSTFSEKELVECFWKVDNSFVSNI